MISKWFDKFGKLSFPLIVNTAISFSLIGLSWATNNWVYLLAWFFWEWRLITYIANSYETIQAKLTCTKYWMLSNHLANYIKELNDNGGVIAENTKDSTAELVNHFITFFSGNAAAKELGEYGIRVNKDAK